MVGMVSPPDTGVGTQHGSLVMFSQVRWCLCSLRTAFHASDHWGKLGGHLSILTGWAPHSPHIPPACSHLHGFLLQLYSPPQGSRPLTSLLPQQGLCTCCSLGPEFSFIQISSTLSSSLPASTWSGGTLSKEAFVDCLTQKAVLSYSLVPHAALFLFTTHIIFGMYLFIVSIHVH